MLIPKGTSPDGEPIYDLVPRDGLKIFDPPPTHQRAWRVWGSAEVLLGMTRRADVPPVVTTGPAFAGPGVAGAIGQPGTAALFGGPLLDDWRAGLRAELGVWLDESRRWGVEARFYSLFSTSEQFIGTGNGSNVLNLPQVATVAGTTIQFPIYVGFPGATTGSVSTTAQTSFAGGDLSLRHLVAQSERFRFDALFGYRQLHLGDQLAAGFDVTTPAVPGIALMGSDNIRSRNNFYGGQLGGVGTWTRKRLSLEGLAAVALGVNVSDVDFDRTRQAAAGVVTPIPLMSSSLQDRTDYFGVAVEAGVKVGFRVNDHLKLRFGYTALYWANLRRAEEQYAFSTTLTGKTTDFYSHMFSWGAEFLY